MVDWPCDKGVFSLRLLVSAARRRVKGARETGTGACAKVVAGNAEKYSSASGRAKREMLDHVLVRGARHFDALVRQYKVVSVFINTRMWDKAPRDPHRPCVGGRTI
jgi:hypothetical protein